MDKFKKTALNIALAGAVFAGMSLPAYAVGVLATSTIELKNLRFHDDSGTSFSNLNFEPTSTSGEFPAGSNTTDITATLNGVTKDDGGVEIKPFELLKPGSGNTINDLTLDYVANDFCVGSGCTLVNNDFNNNLMTSFSRDLVDRTYSDSLLTGTAINYDLNGDGVINGNGVFIDHDSDPLTPDIEVFDFVTTGSHVGAESTVELISDGLGFANVGTELTTAVTFKWEGPATKFNISFDLSVYSEAFVDSIPNAPESANAVAAFRQTFVLRDEVTGSRIVNWNLTDSVSRTDGALGIDKIDFYDGPVTLSSSQLLVAGREYSFYATTGSDVTASLKIPEPASIALFGLGLLGLSQIRRRK